MTVGAPLGLVAALAAVPVVAAYFLRRRQPPRVVSALFLWRVPSPQAQEGPRFERFTRQVSLLLELAAVLAAALFLGDVRCGVSRLQKHAVVVVDGSLSMNARVDGVSVASRVRTEVAELVGRSDVASLTVVESGVHPRIVAGPQWDAPRALAALASWEPSQPWHDVQPALQVALDLAGREGEVAFFTDGPLEAAPARVAVHAVGRALDNVAFVSASRRDVGGVATVVVQVASFSTQPSVRVVVRAEARGVEAVVQQLELVPDATSVVQFSLSTTEPIEVTLPDDALVEDGHVTLSFAPVRPVRVELRPGLDAVAESALRRFLSIADGVVVETPGALTFGPVGSDAGVELGAVAPLRSFVGPFFTRASHPVLDDVHLGGVVWTAGQSVPGRALVNMGDAVLLAEDEATGALRVNLELGRSNVHRTAAWPVLLGNVVQWAAARQPGFARPQVLVGDEVQVTTAGACVLHHDALEQRVATRGTVVLAPLPRPGRWTLRCDGNAVDGIDVLPLDARESDLRQRSTVTAPPMVAATAPDDARPQWPLVVLVVALVSDAWALRRR